MGEVYRATDPDLKRDVAIKFIPESMAGDAQRLARFRREAELLAELNHTNIARVYDLAKDGDRYAIVMELVEGSTLAELIERGPIPLDEAVGIAHQIGAALEVAHAHGIVHRDLKPANVMVGKDGVAKVLDFGIAREIEARRATSGSDSPAPALTEVGTRLGTANYMSPEQSRGKPVDRRTDIWAFGCVLYEMLVGTPAFGGEDESTTLARVLEREPDLTKLPLSVPASVRNAIRFCLQKDPKRRVRDIGDVLLALDGAFEEAGRGEVAGGAARGRLLRRSLVLAAAGLAGAAIVAVPVWRLWPRIEPRQRAVFPVGLNGSSAAVGFGFAVSADGNRIAAVRRNPPSIIVRSLGEDDWRPLAGTEGQGIVGSNMCFSPEGDKLAFTWESREVLTVSLEGGVPTPVASEQPNVRDCYWGDDAGIVFVSDAGVVLVSADERTSKILIPLGVDERDQFLFSPQLLPGGKLLYWRDWYDNPHSGEVVVVDLATGIPQVVDEVPGKARYVPSSPDPDLGHLVYPFESSVFAVPFHLALMKAGDTHTQFPYDVAHALDAPLFSYATVSGSGTLAYWRGSVGGRTVQWLDPAGTQSPTSIPAASYFSMALGPQRDRVVLPILGDEGTGGGFLELHVFGSSPLRLAHEGYATAPVWFPDGLRLAYAVYPGPQSRLPEIQVVSAAGGMPSRLGPIAGTESAMPTSIHPDSSVLIGHAKQSGRDDWDLWIMPLDAPAETDDSGPRSAGFLFETTYDERHPTFSPDGRYYAYSSDESGQSEIYVRPYSPGSVAPKKISSDGGHEPRWNPDGTLTYLNGNRIMAVVVTTTPEFRIEGSETVAAEQQRDFATGILGDTFSARVYQYDVDEDGDRFLVWGGSGIAPPELQFRRHWFEELKEKAPYPDSW
jgi:serine/threonine-protein kinase